MMLNHVTLPAHDYAASPACYTALGLTPIVAAPPRYARFEMDGGSTLSFEIMDDGRAGTAEVYLHCDDVDATYTAAGARGIVFDFEPRDETYLGRRAGVTDPAGNLIVRYTAGTNQRFPPWRIDGRTD